MTKSEYQNKSKFQIANNKLKVLVFVIWILNLFCALNFNICHSVFAQEADLEFTLDIASSTIPLPKIFRPNLDLSGRGFNREPAWPQTVAAKEVLDVWQKDIGFGGLYRIQYNLWEINELSKDADLQNKLLNNYEEIIKNINNAGGTAILDIFGTPAGLGRVLDKKSPPRDLKAFKELVKSTIRYLSCNKRYNIWYEVWSAPDMDDFFLGRKTEYLNLYRQVAESINELEAETKIHIPIGAPSVSWWFQDVDGNTISTPEKSLIYELIKFCNHYRLPLDFITWHGYSTDPGAEKENTIYNKTAVTLIRDWLTYFNFDRNTLLIVDEWNFDSNANVLPQRHEESFISSSYIPSRIKNMYEAGIDYQLYFSLEDFNNNKEGLLRNVGIFSFDPEYSGYKGSPKSTYNVFRMLSGLGSDMFLVKLNDEFVGATATKAKDGIVVLIYNYIDPDIATNFLSKNIAALNTGERKILLNIIKSQRFEKILLRQLDIPALRATGKVNAVLKKAQELNDKAKKFVSRDRNIKISIKGLKDRYLYERYVVDASCSLNCEYAAYEKKEINAAGPYQEILALKPYSVHMIVLKKKPPEPETAAVETNVSNKTQETSTKE
jgi:hypothetical protein